jgi:hypothetical protein
MLGQLDDNALGRESCLGEVLKGQAFAEVPLDDGERHDVEEQPPGELSFDELLDGKATAAQIELHRAPAGLGGGEQPQWRMHRRTLGTTHQRLIAMDARLGRVDDRLKDDRQPILAEDPLECLNVEPGARLIHHG